MSCNGYSDVITGRASSILAGCLQSCSWVRGLLFDLFQALVYVAHGSVCEEHIDDLSQFVTNTSSLHLLHDAALIGKAVKDGTAKLGETLSCKSTLLANDKSLEKLIVAHFGAEGVPILCRESHRRGTETAAGNRRRAANQWKRIWKRQTKGQESQPSAQDELGGAKTHDDGHPPCSSLWTHRTRSFHRTGQRDVQELENGHGD